MLRRPIIAFIVFSLSAIAFADEFPAPVNTQAAGEHPPSPREMLDLFELPEGFQVKLFAGEPDVQQPIAFDFDDKGRIWVAENYTYSSHGKIDPNLRDRVIILHDKDGDGEHDERKVFWDKGSMLTGLTWGYGGLWVLNDGTLSFIPDKDGDDVPDDEPVVMLNGWTKNAGHNFVSGLLWGPDGWLYGRHGITDTSYPGTPDTPKGERQPINCGIWRFHPTKHTFEVVCHGTTNPWGLDYNEYGDMFMTNNVIGHLWHVIPGAHYERMFGQDFNPHLYELMPQIADHYHWDTTGKWSESRDGVADDLGGGHSHCGGMIYYGQNFPKEYHGKIFMCNTHGRCVNVNRLERKGSTYVGKREPNFLKVNTPWFRGVELKYGPRGCVYLTDWSDNGECHDHDGVHRTSGRIYRISYGEPGDYPENMAALQSPEYPSNLQDGWPNEWLHRREFRRQLEWLSSRSPNDEARIEQLDIDRYLLNGMHSPFDIRSDRDSAHRLAFVDELDVRTATHLLMAADAEMVADAVALVTQSPELLKATSPVLAGLLNREARPRVLLAFAAAMQRVPIDGLDDAVLTDLAAITFIGLCDNKIVGRDHNLTLMAWYAAERMLTDHPTAKNYRRYSVPKLRKFFVRRLASDWNRNETLINNLLWLKFPREKSESEVLELFQSLSLGMAGQTRLKEPKNWAEAKKRIRKFENAEITTLANEISAKFGSDIALDGMRKMVADRSGDHLARSRAIQSLAENGDEPSIPVLLPLLTDRAVYVDVARALAAFDDPRIPAELLKRWDGLRHGSQEAAMDTLVSRKSYAAELIKAIDDGRVDSGALTAAHVRQLVSFNDPNITKIIEAKWGVVNQSSEAKQTMIGDLKKRLTPDVLAAADLENGAALFKKSCANCHKLYGEGGKIGPDLTGANRGNMDYLLGNIVDPSGEVPKQFTVSVIALTSGRVITGVVIGETEQVVTVQTDKEQMTIAVSDIDERTRTTKSLMPDGLLDSLTPDQIRDLFAFVMKRR